VGDQGVKAAIATPPPSTNVAFGEVRHGLQGAPRNALENVAAGTAKPFASIKPDDARLSLVTSWQQAEFLADSVNSPQPLFHDLASFSTGLLTNVTAGGFRKDLSMQLERPFNSAPRDPLYTVGGEPGINLNELWVYYNAYKEVKYSGSYTYSTGGRFSNGTPHVLLESGISGCLADDEFHLKQPTIISYQLILSLQAFPQTVSGRTVSRLHLVCDPVLTLWNPLDIAVVIPTTTFLTVKYWQVPYDISIRVNGGPPMRAPFAASLSGQRQTDATERDQNFMSIQMGTTQGGQIVLKPGQVVKYSQSGPVVRRTANQGGRHQLVAQKGFNYGGGFAFPLTDLTGRTIDLNPADQITYEAFPNKITAGKTSLSGNSVSGANAHSRHFSVTHHEIYVGEDRDGNLGSLGYGNMAIDWDFGNKRLRNGEVRAVNQPGTKDLMQPGSRLTADKFPDVFKPVTGSQTRPLSASQLIATKSPFLMMSFDAKTEVSSATGTRSLARFNPKAHHIDFYDLTPAERDRLPYEFKGEPMTTWVNRSLDLSPDGSGFFGGGMTAKDGTGIVCTHSFPREPLVSLAAFQHSFANGFEIQRPVEGYASLNTREPMMPHISHAIGNSMAPSVMDSNRTESTLPGNRPLADHSYLANLALWDTWFLSGIAPRQAATMGSAADQKTVASDFFKGTRKLPVVRYLPDIGSQNSTTLVNSLFSGATPSNNAIQNIASYLRVDGMFNVNSTSVEAWKAMLGSLKGRPIVVRDNSGKESLLPAESTSGNPVAGLMNPENLVAKGDGFITLNDPSQWTGRRELTDDEINELAIAIVGEVRKRGPFLSLADFVNRRVGTDRKLARAGAIQSALDSDEVRINRAFTTGGRGVGDASSRFAFKEAEDGPISYGMPGIVKQADILTPIAPVLSARSDSFVIRAYGEAVDGNGRILAQAWCEAVIERGRDFVDPADRAESLPTTWKRVNQDFGRRYQMVSFRWLSASEV